MALIRPTRLWAAKRGTSPATITGVTAVQWRIRRKVVYAQHDSDLGPTAADTTGWEITGTLVLEDITQIATLRNLAHTGAASQLICEYKRHGSAVTRLRTFDQVRYGSMGNLNFQEGGSEGRVARYTLAFTAVFATADTALADTVAVSAGS